MKSILTLSFSLLVMITIAQSPGKKVFIEDADEIKKAAKAQLTADLENPESKLAQFIAENNLEGIYTIDLQIDDKSKISSTFVRDREEGTIKDQDMLKDYLFNKYRFNFKVPKRNFYKIRYTFNLNQ